MALVEERHTPPLQESRRQHARVGRKGIAWAPTMAVASIVAYAMGAEEALNAAAGDERVAAAVAEGAGVGNYRDSIANGAHPVAKVVNWTQYAFTDLLSDASQPVGIAASIDEIAPRPVLLIVGDDAIEKTMGPIYRDAGGRTTELWMLSDTPHTDGLEVHPAAYKRRVLEIFEASLLTLGSS